MPPSPPLAVQSTAIRSASPVSTEYVASMNTERDLRSRISIVGSYAFNGNVCPDTSDVTADIVEGCITSNSGVELYAVNYATVERNRYSSESHMRTCSWRAM